MRILVFNDRRAEREAMIRALPAESCRVEALSEEQAANSAVEIRRRENRRVSASELCEGMIVAHDVRNGILLVPMGSRLTDTTANKLAMLLGPRFFLEVAPVAGLGSDQH